MLRGVRPLQTGAVRTLAFAQDGAELVAGAARCALDALEAIFAPLATDRPGLRLHGLAGLAPMLASDGVVGGLASKALGAPARAVRALLFDKTAAANWALGWHQDRTICVEARRDVAGFGPWTIKDGLIHVEPPFDHLARMTTLRVHLDDLGADNAPLLIAPGSHRRRVTADGIAETVQACGAHACLAEAGDVWLYATPILHASEAARGPTRRRVLQVDFAAFDLPGGLEWLGV
jgi:hypothetical protein